MSGKEMRKSRPNPNLKILDVLQQQAQIRCYRKTSTKPSIKKKTDQKMLIQQFRNHVDDYPIMFRQKETEPVVYNTTLSITKSNNECQSQGRRTTTGLPRRQARYELQQSRRKQSFSICTYEPNDPDRSIKSNSRSQTKNRGRNIYQSDKENQQIQGRHSLIERRHTRSHFNAHVSCNDEQRSKSRKSTTPISIARHRNRNNASCMDHIGPNYQTISLQKDKKHQRRGTCQLTKQSGKPSKKELKKPKTSKKQSLKRKSNEKDRSKIIKNRPSVPTLTTMPKTLGKKRKPSAQLDRSSDQDDYDYPISKYINTKKKKSQGSQKLSILTNDLCKKILTQSSLIKSSVQTSKKSQMGRGSLYDFDYVQRITQLEEEGTSIKKRKPTKQQQPLVLDEKHSFQFNLDEVRLFQRRKRQQKQRRQKLRRPIFQQIQEQYPQLNEEQVRFLVSVIFIQRFWREKKLQKQLKQKLQHPLLNNIQKSPQRQMFDREQILEQSHLDVSPVMNQAPPLIQPLYDLLIHHKKNSQVEDDESNIRSSRKSLNPLEKYSEYFKKLEAVPTDPTDLSPSLSAEPLSYPPLQINKPNFKKIKKIEPIIELAQQKQKEDEQVVVQPYGGSITQRSLCNSSLNCQKQVFPPLQMVSSRRHVLLEQHAQHLSHLDQLYLMQQIDTERYKEKKYNLQEGLRKKLSEIKHDNKDIQKGYLKYIDFLRKIKGDSKPRGKSRLRRVNSEDGYMSRVYSRFCSIETFSNDSDSLKELKERLLVRRQFGRTHQQSSSSRQGALLTLRRNLSRQQLLLNNQHYISGAISPRAPSPKQQIDMSEKIKIDQGQSFCQDQGSSGNFHIRDCNEENQQVDMIRQTFRQDSQPQISFTVRQFSLQTVDRNSPDRGNAVPASPMINLNEFLSRVKEETSRSSSSIIGQLTEQDQSQSPQGHSLLHLDMSLKRQQNSILLAEHVFQILISQLCQETKRARGLDKKIRNKLQKRKKKLPAINTEPSGVADYIDSLIKFLKVSRFGHQVLQNFNTVLGYAPINFLRMLRDPEFIPPEEYVQIIPDECYMELEEVQFSRLLPQSTDPKFSNFLKGISSVHNRAIFECVKIQLLRLKPYGEEGLPYPWDPEPVFNKQSINQNQFYDKLDSVKARLVDSSHCQCGIILQRYTVRTAEQLQKVHDDNQDRLLEVLEAQVRDDATWNFINMQLLETRMDIDVEVFHWIVDEAFDEIKRVCSKR